MHFMVHSLGRFPSFQAGMNIAFHVTFPWRAVIITAQRWIGNMKQQPQICMDGVPTCFLGASADLWPVL